MRSLHWIFIMLLLTSCASQNHSVQSESAPFLRHEEKGPFKSYLAMNLPYPEFAKIREDLEAKNHLKLLNRGEAHITVITPPEYDTILSKKISIQEIHDLAEKMKIQESPIKKICVGQGIAKLNGQDESTYFVVVHADRLFEIRKSIQNLYVSRGGKATDFNAELFYPHVTLGYTKRDLHYEDGVVKDATRCLYAL
ncbi:MAG TPA: 2'-5' RNA ligase family protein [Bdellovibrio sp.]|nr:2'-5' RNA ligase family protein [Bdellovibrio sp.]